MGKCEIQIWLLEKKREQPQQSYEDAKDTINILKYMGLKA